MPRGINGIKLAFSYIYDKDLKGDAPGTGIRESPPPLSGMERGAMVSQMIQFYEDRLGRVITEAEQEAVRTMYEEFRRHRTSPEDRKLALHRIGDQPSSTRPVVY